MKVGIIGCGNLGIALAKGIRAKHAELPIFCSKRNIGSISNLQSKFTKVTADNKLVLAECDLIILALKPYTILDFVKEHAASFDSKRHTIVSVATGIQLSEIKAQLPAGDWSLFRAMPNTGAGVGESMTALSFHADPVSTGVAENLVGLENKVVFYPNPAVSDVIYANENITELQIISPFRNVVCVQNNIKNSEPISISKLPDGVYVIKALINGNIYFTKLIVR